MCTNARFHKKEKDWDMNREIKRDGIDRKSKHDNKKETRNDD
jgi:hypothetical protein